MKKYFVLFIAIIVLLNPVLTTQKQGQVSTLVFYVNHIDVPNNDYVQISLTIEVKDVSLTKAIKAGASNVQEITSLAKDFCQQNSKKKTDCKQIVDAGVFQIEPRYQLIRKSPVFMGFTITHQMTIAVKSVDNIGHLVDKILSKDGVTLNGFNWKASKQNKVGPQTIAEGMQQGQKLCGQLGLRLGKVINMQEMLASQVELAQSAEEQGEQEKQQQKQQEQNLTVFKFTILCTEKTEKSKKQQL